MAEGTKASCEERGTEGQHDRRPFALWTVGSSYPTPLAHPLHTTRLRQPCHAHAEEGLLAGESPRHVSLAGDRPAGAGSAEHGPAAAPKMWRG